MNICEKIISENWYTIKLIIQIIIIVAAFATIFGAFFAFSNYINDQIETKINDSNYIASLSKTLRPFCVFKQKGKIGIILYDHGAEKFIKDISFNQEDAISIELTQFLQYAPLLMTVGANQYSYEVDKKNNKTFVYKLSAPAVLTGMESKKVAENKYFLEILR